MALIGVPLAVVISLLWYLPGIRAQGQNRVLQKGDYIRTALVYGFLYSCLLIIITEIMWDIFFGSPGSGTLKKEILSDFFRAALLEEFFKMTGFLLAKRKIRPARKIDYIMMAGLIGLVYGVVEKAVTGNPASVIIGLALPMHIMWQFNQGGHFFEYDKAKAAGNQALAGKELFLAVGVPFLLHGCWDSILSIIGYCVEQEDSTVMQVIGGVLIVVVLAAGVVYTIKTIRKVCRIAREEA